MLKISDYEKHVIEKFGLTPEQARDKAIEILESVRFNRKQLEGYMLPVEEIDGYGWEVIAGVLKREQEVRKFAENWEDGLSQFAHALNLEVYLTTD